ncbi:MAG: hypothetical protein FD157_3507 [Rhodocyclaceae bacterium]|nr:MAG: hypothetical protein FD157_3507 [Rhodocyclaceae bacterium]TND01880.1 MAG: hypothetical protein FD118_2139 [Rhodocyclaceae bacterium]
MRAWWILLALCSNLAIAASLEVAAGRTGLFFVDGFVGAAPLRLLIDTGADGVTIPRTVANQAGEYGGCKWVRKMTANGPIDLCQRRVASLRFGPFTFKDWPVTITTDESVPSGLIGTDILRLMTIEMAKDKMRLSM